jgi:hypothetical protein
MRFADGQSIALQWAIGISSKSRETKTSREPIAGMDL